MLMRAVDAASHAAAVTTTRLNGCSAAAYRGRHRGDVMTMTLSSEPAGSETPEDRLLLGRIAQRERVAFEALYRRYYRRVFHFVARLVRNDSTAEEVVADVMFAMWQGAATFAGSSSVSTWLLGIAWRQAMKTLERNRKHSRVDADQELLDHAIDIHPTANPEAAAQSDSYHAILLEAIAALGDHHRIVVELTAEGHSYGEIARITGSCENTVRTRMFHARRQLKRFLARTALSDRNIGNSAQALP
jgi:RNA polymerase sigma-70 factor (ECF subfamily)